MKKKVLFIVIGLCIAMLAWGCGKKNPAGELDAEKDSSAETDNNGADAADEKAPVKEKYEVSDYITLGKYKGVEVTVEKLEVTDEDVDTAIQEALEANATEEEVTDRPVQEGDIVNIDFEGLKDGVAFENGSAENQDLEIGSGTFIDGFEEGLMGANVGDKLSLDLTFPEDYEQSPDLAGQAVVFNVTVNSIKVSVVPELTEDYVKENTDYESIDAYKDATRSGLEKENEDTMENNKINSLLTAIIEASEISSYPQTLLDYYDYEMEDYYTKFAQMYYGYELADFLSANNMTEESFGEQKQSYAKDRAAQELVLNAIIETEGIKLTDDEYEAGVADYMKEYNYTSEEEFLQNVTEEQVKESLIWEKAIDLIVDNSVEV